MASDNKLIKLSQLSIVKGYIDDQDALKADKVSSAVNGNFAGLDANGNLTDSGSKASDFAASDILDDITITSSGSGTFIKDASVSSGTITVTKGTISESEVPTLHLSKITDAGTAAASNVATTPITEGSTSTDLPTSAQVATFVQEEVADLAGAMHFRGVITRQTGETDAQAIARAITDPESGDVCVMSDNAKEYIYSGTAWREIGEEGVFVTKTTTIAGVDLQNNITKDELNTALGIADMIADAQVITGVDTDNFKLVNKVLYVADGKRFITTAEGNKLTGIAVDTTEKSVTDGVGNTLSDIMVESDASITVTTDTNNDVHRTVSINGSSISDILTRSEFATNTEVQAIFNA